MQDHTPDHPMHCGIACRHLDLKGNNGSLLACTRPVQQENKKEPSGHLHNLDMSAIFSAEFRNTDETRKRLWSDLTALSPQGNRSKQGNHCGKRRFSVSSESYHPPEFLSLPAIYKPPDIRKQIEEATRQNLLFKNLDPEIRGHIFDAMFERHVTAGETVIKQGEPAELFYVVIHGMFYIYKHDKYVTSVGKGGSFGELALLYTNPRAATVQAFTDGTLWAIDRENYNRIVTTITYNRSRVYENFLRSVKIFESLESEAITKLADAMEVVECNDGDTVVRQGETGDLFYIIERGHVDLVKHDGKQEIRLPSLGPGNYFGELALLNDTPRQATVKARDSVHLITLKRDAFDRLLSETVIESMHRHAESYNTPTTSGYSGPGGVNVLHT